ncbi:LysR family transcriptional regulator [Shewanella subflava]|uniref:LysR family transcriptional regulator n=1 Tax=Shewanella subflava TaxID=2986476 RepID=A0ABT3I797_9GAMM|nr:LysR family transcriptional regulator [Shewanella subflava]MCW3171934.1 LysR family transcriptional regulator [Shewanella subflava]
MDLNALNIFVTLFKTGSTLRAAAKLNRSQSFVSKILAQLKEDLGDPLFIRTASGLQPTSYAIQIAPKLQNAIEQISIALEPESFSPAKLEFISIHTSESLLVMIAKPLINKIRAETDAIVELRQWRKESNNQLIDGNVDIGIQALKERPQALYQKKLPVARPN